jgi:hypothetical protein
VAHLITNARTISAVSPELAYLAGKAFARFEADLSTMPETVREPIPHFHDIAYRVQQLSDVRSNASQPRVLSLLTEVDRRRTNFLTLPDVPVRVCHADTKVDNILFDASTGEPLCVIDLDTVMMDCVYADFGDFLRTAANPAGENARDLALVAFDMSVFRAFTRGFLEGGSVFLEDAEVVSLIFGVKLYAFMQCVRFLWDYLQGSQYYKTTYREPNLDRAEVQMRLLMCIEDVEVDLRSFVDEMWAVVKSSRGGGVKNGIGDNDVVKV